MSDAPDRTSGAATGSLEACRLSGLLSSVDVQFAERLAALYGETRPSVLWAAALACRQEAAGHVCADLAWLVAEGLEIQGPNETGRFAVVPAGLDLASWCTEIADSPMVADASRIDDPANSEAALVLDSKGLLYLRRSFESQAELAGLLLERAEGSIADGDAAAADRAVARWSPASSGGVADEPTEGDPNSEIDWTAKALRTALLRRLAVVTGGPGTGKTTLVIRLVALLIEEAFGAGHPAPVVRLFAPTGKAAAALSASFGRQRNELDVDVAVREALPTTAETIHRALLGQSRRDALGRAEGFSIDADVVIVDEASMVDLSVMTRLFQATRGVPRLVLLGDPDQLASVDAGAVLAEICAGTRESGTESGMAAAGDQPAGPLSESIVTLRKSHRFSAEGGIGRLAAAIRAGDADEALGLLDDSSLSEIERVPCESPASTLARLIDSVRALQRDVAKAESSMDKLAALGGYRVLCALRRGALGVEALSPALDEAAAFERGTSAWSDWWLGRMLLVTRNAPDQNLWNGDVGLIEETSAGLRALFEDGHGGVRNLPAGRLPEHESAIAMSVHKSQGSEFDVVDLVLGDQVSRLSSRELLYTGVTRARSHLRIHASPEMIRASIATRVRRASGLRELLWPGSEQ